MSRTRPTRSSANSPTSGSPRTGIDRVSDFQRNLAIVPVSAHTGEGIADLLMVMIGLAQRYMGEELSTFGGRAGCRHGP